MNSARQPISANTSIGTRIPDRQVAKILSYGLKRDNKFITRRMKRICVKEFNSFKSITEFEKEYYLNMSTRQRLAIAQFLREVYYKLKGKENAHRKRLRRTVKIIQQA